MSSSKSTRKVLAIIMKNQSDEIVALCKRLLKEPLKTRIQANLILGSGKADDVSAYHEADTDRNTDRQQTFLAGLPREANKSWIALDEAAFFLNHSRKYAWSERGRPVVVKRPNSRGTMHSLILAVSPDGVVDWRLMQTDEYPEDWDIVEEKECHGVLCCDYTNCNARYWDRDVNAVINMVELLKSEVLGR